MRPLAILAVLAPAAAALEVLRAEGSPHDGACGAAGAACSSCPAQAMNPAQLLPAPLAASLNLQADTLQRVDEHTHLGVPVPVFTFLQPRRLSPLELPFGVALMSEVPDAGLVAMEVPEHDAADSWFTDYAWRRVLYCASGAAGRPLHLGWVYERKAGAVGPGPAQFVALIVRPEQEVERCAGAQCAKEPLASQLSVGIEAPHWMIAMAAVTATRAK